MNPDNLADLVVDTLKRTVNGPYVAGRFTTVEKALAALEQRIAGLEQKPFVKFAGTWQGERSYEPGAAVVHQGGLWICKAPTTGEPSKDFVSWQLAVKSRSL